MNIDEKITQQESERIAKASAVNFKEYAKSVDNMTDEQQIEIAKKIKSKILTEELSRRLNSVESKFNKIKETIKAVD